ncbi:T9SS type A sorting domain-containing protein [Runella sp.]|uniref:T9SS type A sorting domain-containing protein n=1 Tax=Runella sp. TaxID=1960881 RepID=UPI003D0DFF10
MKNLSTFVIFFSLLQSAYATHLLGGEIRTKRLNTQGLTYEISVNLYMDDINGASAADAQSQITICVGEGNQTLVMTRATRRKVSSGVSLNTYYANFTYAAPGTYTVSLAIENRGGNFVNFSSVNTSFYIQTTFAANIVNATPVFNAAVGTQTASLKQIFNYNVNAVDTEGDSLVYRLGVSNQGVSNNCTREGIRDFKYPNEITKEGTFSINAATGTLTWNAPTQVGTYAFVIIVEEWRDGVRISETQREVTVNVEDKGGDLVIIPPFEYANNGTITAIETSQKDELQVFPSPARNVIKAHYHSLKSVKVIFQLVDSNGKVVDEHRENERFLLHTHDFEVKHLPSGVYFIRTIGEKIATKKFIKE